MNKYIEITEFGTDKVVKRVDVTGKTENTITIIDNGMNRNLNHDKFYTVENETERKYDCN